jgi:ADP-dependent phosphofructokinase/glucokinase
MSGLDGFLAKSLQEIINKNLGDKTVKRIEDRLFEKFGISLTQAMEEFDKVDLILREFFGKGADGLERRFFESIFQSKSKKSKDGWYTLRDDKSVSTILQAFGDPEKKMVLETVSDTPKIIAEIIEECDLPQTSGYRKINSLIEDGLLYKSGHITRENKKINQYKSAFSNFRINLENKKMSVDIQIADLEKSTIIQTIKV